MAEFREFHLDGECSLELHEDSFCIGLGSRGHNILDGVAQDVEIGVMHQVEMRIGVVAKD